MFAKILILLFILIFLEGCKTNKITNIERDYITNEDTYTESRGWESVSQFLDRYGTINHDD